MARKHIEAELLWFIQFYLEGTPYREWVEKYKIELSSRSFRDYVKKYEFHGVDRIKLLKMTVSIQINSKRGFYPSI